MKKTFYTIAMLAFVAAGSAQSRETTKPANRDNGERATPNSMKAQPAQIGVKPGIRPALAGPPANSANESSHEGQPMPKEIGTQAPVRPAVSDDHAAPVVAPGEMKPAKSPNHARQPHNEAPGISDQTPSAITPASGEARTVKATPARNETPKQTVKPSKKAKKQNAGNNTGNQ